MLCIIFQPRQAKFCPYPIQNTRLNITFENLEIQEEEIRLLGHGFGVHGFFRHYPLLVRSYFIFLILFICCDCDCYKASCICVVFFYLSTYIGFDGILVYVSGSNSHRISV
ncbi:hypothetical protein QVD17_02205 [Tagetes erecta]|uniref:Uncharacterized protein n=1 Tax=Tagetes erecta TaxID=13708 RepID=A0AAD8P265_TARER|nr:hypothetical protein QVD17_02205 [Tagetes erecta]